MHIIAPILAAGVAALIGGGMDASQERPTTNERTTPVVQVDAKRVAEIRLINRNRELVESGDRRKPGTVYRANRRTVCTVYLSHRKCITKRLPRRTASAAMSSGSSSYADGVIAQMERIDRAGVSYLWGGGHGARIPWSSPVSPMDCSGSVSRALGIAPRVSGAFGSVGRPGWGKVNVLYNDGHVLMAVKVGGTMRYWGTSGENPGGGPGWHSARDAGAYNVVHVA